MRISHNKDNQISGSELRNVSNYKDLGLIMASELKQSKDVEQIVHKANEVLGFLKRTVGGKNKDIFFKFVQNFGSPKEELRESPQTKEDRRWRMTRGVNTLVRRREFLSLVLCNPFPSAARSYSTRMD